MRVYVCIDVRIDICMYYVCMYDTVCIHVCMNACICIYVMYIYIYILNGCVARQYTTLASYKARVGYTRHHPTRYLPNRGTSHKNIFFSNYDNCARLTADIVWILSG